MVLCILPALLNAFYAISLNVETFGDEQSRRDVLSAFNQMLQIRFETGQVLMGVVAIDENIEQTSEVEYLTFNYTD